MRMPNVPRPINTPINPAISRFCYLILELAPLRQKLSEESCSLFASSANAQITVSNDLSGRRLFINADPPVKINLGAPKHTNIYLPREAPFAGRTHPTVYMDRDGVEKLVREAADPPFNRDIQKSP